MAVLQVTTKTMSHGQGITGILNPVPDRCPLCHTSVFPRPLLQLSKEPSGTKRQILAVFQCTKVECQEPFNAYYDHSGKNETGHENYNLTRCGPMHPQPVDVSHEVATVSSTFVEVYTQALASESYELNQLTGIGLRKALEFLIKDFIIIENPASKSEVETLMLGPCIHKFVTGVNVKQCATLAAWLGNDETHYVRRWTDKDVGDLKTLIRLTINWIESVLLTRKYKKEMNPSGA